MSTVADKLAKKSSHKTSAKQVRLRLVYIDFWSAVKLSFLAAVAVAIVTIVSFFLIYMVVQATGLIARVDEFFQSFSDGGVTLTQFVGLLVFAVAAQAELTQAPFDMPIAESELVAGYQTEYSGFRFLLYFIGEFASAGAFGALAAVLFLGGWWIPGIDVDSNVLNVLGPLVMFAKLMLFMLVVFWVRFTYPRLREDQLQKLAWKVLIPLSLANIAVTGVLKVAF